MDLLLGLLVMLCLPAYAVVQVMALVRWPLGVSVVPLAAMAGALVLAVVGFAQGSNLAPIFLVLLAPVALAWLGAAYLLRR